MTHTIYIEGMSCQHCVKAVTEALKAVDGVKKISVDLKGKKATVDTKENVSQDALKTAIEDAGYDVVGF